MRRILRRLRAGESIESPGSAGARSNAKRCGGSDHGRVLRASAALTLLALALMVWSMVQPTPLPVMLAMTVGQGLGTLAFALYGYVVLADLLRIRRARRAAAEPEDG
jgi:hypothetical protein